MLRRVRAIARGDRALPGLVRGWGRQMAGPRELSGGVPGLEGWGRPGEAAGTSPPVGRAALPRRGTPNTASAPDFPLPELGRPGLVRQPLWSLVSSL